MLIQAILIRICKKVQIHAPCRITHILISALFLSFFIQSTFMPLKMKLFQLYSTGSDCFSFFVGGSEQIALT